jgi:hypothetical protein
MERANGRSYALEILEEPRRSNPKLPPSCNAARFAKMDRDKQDPKKVF